MTDLRSAPVPGPRPDDHIRGPGDAPVVLFYGDFACPRCAVAHEGLRSAPVRVVFRHFALKAKHPRALALAHAAEAAGAQDAFWAFCDAVYADQGSLEDPHLWARCEALGLDLGRFEDDRRGSEIAERVQRDVHDALRAGATGTPTVWIEQGSEDLLGTMVRFGIREARRIGPPTDAWARKGSTYE
jgi:protein-disulfide isomerase